jgi:hypothetical protein
MPWPCEVATLTADLANERAEVERLRALWAAGRAEVERLRRYADVVHKDKMEVLLEVERLRAEVAVLRDELRLAGEEARRVR